MPLFTFSDENEENENIFEEVIEDNEEISRFLDNIDGGGRGAFINPAESLYNAIVYNQNVNAGELLGPTYGIPEQELVYLETPASRLEDRTGIWEDIFGSEWSGRSDLLDVGGELLEILDRVASEGRPLAPEDFENVANLSDEELEEIQAIFEQFSEQVGEDVVFGDPGDTTRSDADDAFGRLEQDAEGNLVFVNDPSDIGLPSLLGPPEEENQGGGGDSESGDVAETEDEADTEVTDINQEDTTADTGEEGVTDIVGDISTTEDDEFTTPPTYRVINGTVYVIDYETGDILTDENGDPVKAPEGILGENPEDGDYTDLDVVVINDEDRVTNPADDEEVVVISGPTTGTTDPATSAPSPTTGTTDPTTSTPSPTTGTPTEPTTGTPSPTTGTPSPTTGAPTEPTTGTEGTDTTSQTGEGEQAGGEEGGDQQGGSQQSGSGRDRDGAAVSGGGEGGGQGIGIGIGIGPGFGDGQGGGDPSQLTGSYSPDDYTAYRYSPTFRLPEIQQVAGMTSTGGMLTQANRPSVPRLGESPMVASLFSQFYS